MPAVLHFKNCVFSLHPNLTLEKSGKGEKKYAYSV
jgi:hypothetical protein